jgi:lysophospholipase L1-like esterase
MAELAKANGIKVVLSSVLPVLDYPWRRGLQPAEKIVMLNSMIKKYALEKGHIYLDYWTAMANTSKGMKTELAYDGVHPTLEGYHVMEPLVEKAIAEALKK